MNRVEQTEKFRNLTLLVAITIMCMAIAWVDKLTAKLRKIYATASSSLVARKASRSIRAILIQNRQQS